MFTQILIYNPVIVPNYAKTYFYDSFGGFAFFLLPLSSPLAEHPTNRPHTSCCKFQLVCCLGQGCSGAVGNDLIFIVAIRNLLVDFNRKRSFYPYISTVCNIRICSSRQMFLQTLGSKGSPQKRLLHQETIKYGDYGSVKKKIL